MASALFQFHHDAGDEPTVAGVAARYGLDPSDIDEDYGFVLIDPTEGLWVTKVKDRAAPAIEAAMTDADRRRGVGIFADVRIEPADGDGGDGGNGFTGLIP